MKAKFLFVTALFILTTFTLNAQIPNYIPQNGLVGYWPFNNNCNDLGTNGLNGTPSAVLSTTDRNNVPNSAYYFNGTNSFIEIPHNSNFNINELTISLWYYANNYTDGSQRILISKRESNGWGTSFQCGLDSIGSRGVHADFTINGGNSWARYNSASLNTGTWYNYTYVHRVDSAFIYVNGNLVCDTITGGNLGFNSLPLRIGQRPNGAHPFSGKIDDLIIFNRALNKQEISQLYNGCNINIISQPNNTSGNISSSITLNINHNASNASIQWQSNASNTGWHNLSNSSYYFGTNSNVLTIDSLSLSNNNQLFKAIVSNGSCSTTTNICKINILDTCVYIDTIYTNYTDTTYISVDDTLIIDATFLNQNNISFNSYFEVYPNPAKTFLYISVDDYSNLSDFYYKLYNAQGQVVSSENIYLFVQAIDISNLVQGTYFLKIIDSSQQQFITKKIIVN